MNSGKTIPPPVVADVGIGYVGWPLVVSFGKGFRTIGVPYKADTVVAAVCHKRYLERPLAGFLDLLGPGGVFIDIKSAFDPKAIRNAGYCVWRL